MTSSNPLEPVLLADRPPVARAVAAIVVPSLFGVVAGLVLGWSAPLYWLLQVLAAIGGLLAGFEHRGARSGGVRGLVGGLVYGALLLLAHEVSGAEAEASLGDAPGFLPVVTGLIGCVLGAVGAAFRGRASA